MIHQVRRSSIAELALLPPRLGDTTTAIVGGAAQTTGAALSVVSGAASAGLITLSGTLAASIPVAGAVVAVGLLVYSLLHNSRGLAQDAETTAAVDKGEAYMRQNLAAWNASSKSNANEAQALLNFDQAWQAIVNFCSQASEGTPGQRCISERQRGGVYDYFKLYRDPISNDPLAGAVDRALAEQTAGSTSAAPTAAGAVTTSPALIAWLPLALIAAALMVD
jgi:hypothetical protein